MRVLIIASGNSPKISPFVEEQVNSLKELGLVIDYFLIRGKGILGYLKNYFLLIKTLKNNNCYDIIHAHYGLSGLLATMQTLVPVVITISRKPCLARFTFPLLGPTFGGWAIRPE